ncbi:MAG TPA: NYN domain-containing protein [Solirubrobacterales bacterium]|nr:NYN domain-containing protein [Solirubrobacterales bacterium]
MRIAVFIDWMNIYKAARTAFGLEQESGARGQIDPLQAARVMAAANKRGKAAELVRVEIHRGRPLSNQDPVGHRAATLQAQAWKALDPKVVEPQLRPLRLNPDSQKLEEKGVDVALAACAVEWAAIENVDHVIIFSHDTDLSSVVEVIARLKGPQAVETASWVSEEYRRRIPPIEGVTNHSLREKLFLAIEDTENYGRRARRASP